MQNWKHCASKSVTSPASNHFFPTSHLDKTEILHTVQCRPSSAFYYSITAQHTAIFQLDKSFTLFGFSSNLPVFLLAAWVPAMPFKHLYLKSCEMSYFYMYSYATGLQATASSQTLHSLPCQPVSKFCPIRKGRGQADRSV